MLRSILLGSVVVFALFVLWSPRRALADKLDDFKEAVKETGCRAIPYNSERGECKDQGLLAFG